MPANTLLTAALWLAAAAVAAGLILGIAPWAVPGSALAIACIIVAVIGAAVLVSRARARLLGAPATAVLGALVDTSESPAIVTDASGAVVCLNTAAREWLGTIAPLAHLQAHAALDFDGEDVVTRLRQAAATMLAASAEVPLVNASGDTEWYEVSVRPLAMAPGHMFWSAVDITARRTINDILNHERQDLSDFLYLLPTGAYSVDVDGTFRFANHRFASWLGYDFEELIGRRLEDVIAGTNRPQPDGEWQGEVLFRAQSGETVPALVLQSTYDDVGVTRTRTLVIRDGVRRDTDAAPGRIAYERFRALFDAAPMAIAIADPDGIVVDCNRAFEKLVDVSRSALLGSGLVDRLVAEDRKTFTSELDKVLTGESDGAHFDARVGGPTVAQTSVFVGPLSAQGLKAEDGSNEIEGAVAHFIDVTEQKNLEVQFAQAQ
ncbi:MAG: PAS domain S-box protein, partial [Rhodospirillaceae bacterium]|nr:PAS domain S-box protein [Rhodospirillaceae bacterium]